MKYINVRQLLNNYKASTKELPVIVTKSGLPIFAIFPMIEVDKREVKMKDITNGPKEIYPQLPPKNSIKNSEKKPITITLEDVKKIDVIPDPDLDSLSKPDSLAQTIICEAPNQRCKDWATKRVNFESPDHEDMTLYFCDAHYKKLKGAVEIYSEENI